MKLGVELLTLHPTPLRLGTFFETWLATPSGTVRRSLGRDEYHLGLKIEAGHRLAATGRTHICQLDAKAAQLGENQARAAVMAVTECEPGTPVLFSLRTNLFLDLPALSGGSFGRLVRESVPPLSFRMDHPLVIAQEVDPGRYVLDISRLLFR